MAHTLRFFWEIATGSPSELIYANTHTQPPDGETHTQETSKSDHLHAREGHNVGSAWSKPSADGHFKTRLIFGMATSQEHTYPNESQDFEQLPSQTSRTKCQHDQRPTQGCVCFAFVIMLGMFWSKCLTSCNHPGAQLKAKKRQSTDSLD